MSLERDAAIAYARLAWPIFPLHKIVGRRCDCRAGQDCKSIGKHPIPTRWQNTIASVPAAESQWRDGLGSRGIGLVCGPRADVFGVDIDRRHGGLETVREWARQGMRFGETVADRTGDGWHLIFRWPTELAVEIRAQHLGPGVQCRGAGHFLVLPPSRHRSGCRYAWHRPPEDHEPAPAREWLLELVVANSRSARGPVASDDEQPLVPIGERYDALVRFLGLLRSTGLGEAALVACVDLFLDHAVEIDEARVPLDRAHAYRTARKIARYPPHPNRGPTDFASFREPAPDGFHLADYRSEEGPSNGR